MDIISAISHEEFMPHGYCLLWQPGLIWSSALSDILITLSYYSIPLALVYFARKRTDFEYRWILVLFAAFIVLCGTTHLLGAIIMWKPIYYLDVAVKAATAVVSVFTAVIMWPLIPKLLAMPSKRQLEEANNALQEEIAAREQAEKSQRELAGLLHHVLDAIPAAVFWKNTELRYLGCNRRHAMNIGLASQGQIIGKTDGEFFLPELAEKYRADDRQLLMAGEPIIDLEESYVSPDGQTHHVSTSKVPLSDPDGNVIGLVGAYQDVTERKLAEERLRGAMREIENANQELREFVYIASHDLQEPLRKVSTFGDRLKRHLGSALDEKGADYLARMISASERMSLLIEDLLAFSRVTTRAKPFEPVDLGAVLKEALEDLEMAVRDAGAAVSADPLPVIDADYTQMHQLFLNLIGNSIKYRRTGEPCRIAIRMVINDTERELCGKRYSAGKLILVAVEDNGIGFDEKYADRIFGVFQRLHGKGEYKGTGVGLAICKKIVDRHNGGIEVKSRIGEGSRFTVILPLQKAQEGK